MLDHRVGSGSEGDFRVGFDLRGRLVGWRDVNDADKLSRDPVMRQIVGGRAVGGQAASTRQMARFETVILTCAHNRATLVGLSGQCSDAMLDAQPPQWITLDMDSSVSPTHGDQQGTAEQHIKEGKYAINWTRLSCKRFRDNVARLQLYALADNLGIFLQREDLPKEIADWSLTSLETRLIKRVVRHARKITFQLAEVAASGDLFKRILEAIHRLREPPVPE
jgi:hypothetical protein